MVQCPMRLAAMAAMAILAGGQGTPRVLPKDPGTGEVVFVDDGSCPPGQIKRITGGSNRDYGTDRRRPGTQREVTCLARGP